MNDFIYQNPAKIIFGRDALTHLPDELARYGKKVLLVTGGGSAKRIGLYDRVLAILADCDKSVYELDGIVPNPRLSRVREGIALCREQGVRLVLALGGGSVIDTAKAICDGTPYEGDVWDFFAGKAQPKQRLGLGTILTLPAAGSEMSFSCVVTNEEGWLKRGFNSPLHVPDFSLLNPEWSFTLPPYQTACGCVDIIAHMMERYFAQAPHVEVTDGMIAANIRTVMRNAPIALKQPDNYDARAEIMWAGALAHNGLLNTGREGDWATHKLEHELSGMYDIAHGAGLSILFPAWMRYMVQKGQAWKLAQFATQVLDVPADFGDEAARALEGVARLEAFYRSLGMPVRMSDAGLPADKLEEMARKALPTPDKTLGAYLPLHTEDALAIYRLAV